MKKNITVLFLLIFGLAACSVSEKPEMAIHTSAQAGQADRVSQILKTHTNLVNHQNPEQNARKRTPLHEASNAEVVKVLIEHGAKVDAKDSFSWTPLHTAADGEVVELLVAAGGDVHAKAQRNLTPLHTVKTPDAAKALLRHGADIEAPASQKITPLMWQIETPGDPDVIAVLLANNADISGKYSLDRTLLHMASSRSEPRTVQLLLEKGLDVNARDEINATPLHYAAQKGNVDVAKILLDHGADLTIRLSDDAQVTTYWIGSSPQRKSIAGLTSFELAESEPMKALLKPGSAPGASSSGR